MNYPEWDGVPNCSSVDPDSFFTEDGSSTYPEINMLKRVCSNCDVKTQCLEYALKHEVLGFWSGTTEIERKRMRVKANIQSIPLYLSYS